MRPTIPVLLLILALASCERTGDSSLVLDWQTARSETERAFALLGVGDGAGAREAFRNAYRRGVEVMATLGSRPWHSRDGLRPPTRVEVLCQLAEICRQLGKGDPEYLERALRLSYRAIAEAPEHSTARAIFGATFGALGLFSRAVENLEAHLDSLPPEAPTPARRDLVIALSNLSRYILESGHVGCEAEARKVLNRAWALLPEGERDPVVTRQLTDLNRAYAAAVAAAGERADTLEIARIHARFGFLDLAKEALDKIVSRARLVGEVRWVVARYYYEGLGTRESLEKARQVYERMLEEDVRREGLAPAWVRVHRGLGLIEPALERFGAAKDPSAEMRVELILTRFDRIAMRPETDLEGWKEDLREIDEAASRITVQGARYPEDLKKMADR